MLANILLKIPGIYKFFQFSMGADKMRKYMRDKYILPNKNLKILDIGCGTADILNYLGDADYTGIDMSEEYISFCKSKFKKDNVKFICSDLNDFLKTQSSYYDIILLIGVIHHIDDEQFELCLQQSQKLLKPQSGKIITLDGVYIDSLNKFEKFLLDSDRGKFIRRKNHYDEIIQRTFPNNFSSEINKELYNFPFNIIMYTIGGQEQKNI